METAAIALMRIIGPMYLVVGLSMVIYTKSWSRLLKGFEENHYALVVAAWIGMILGIIMVNIYSIWNLSLGVIVTLTGWLLLIKGIVYFLAPESIIKTIIRWKQNPVVLYSGAAVITVFGAAMSYVAYLA